MPKPAIVATNAAHPPCASPSRALVSAALAGLLCAATPACSSTDDGTDPMTGTTGGAGGASGGASSTGGRTSTGGTSSTGGRATTGGTSSGGAGGNALPATGGIGSGGRAETEAGTEAGTAPDAPTTSTGGADAGSVFPPPNDAGVDCRMDGGPPVVTSSKIVRDLTLEQFTADCDAWHGVVQIPPHCGGFNTCRGMSYDSGTDVFTEHTCRGLSTCGGFSCVLCPP